MDKLNTFSEEKEITLKIQHIDGAYFITSDNPLCKGMCVATRDWEKCFLHVGIQLKVLLDKNHGINV